MRPSLLSTFVCLFVTLSIQAQDWSLLGNSNVSATTSKLGTTNAIPLRFFTNNALRMFIHPTSGNVGIGTTVPTKPLHVNGFGAFGNQVTVANSNRALNLADVNAVMRVLRVHATNAPAVELISRTTADGANIAYWDFYAQPSDKSFRIRDRVTGADPDRLTISSKGYMGIGTQTPLQKLHVIGNGTFTDSFSIGTTLPLQKFHVEGKSFFKDFVGIGTTAPAYPLHVIAKTGSYVISGINTNVDINNSAQNGVGVYGYGATGIYGEGKREPAIYGVGVRGFGFPGVYGIGKYDDNRMVWGSGVSGRGFPGIYGLGEYDQLRDYYGDGIYGYGRSQANGVYGYSDSGHAIHAFISNSVVGYAGYFEGSVYATGFYGGSDRKLKQNITDINSAMDIISKLQPKSYNFRQDGNYKLMNLPSGKHFGLIAQEVEEILPQLVKNSKFNTAKAQPAHPDSVNMSATVKGEIIDFKAINYTELIPVMVKAMQEQQTRIEQQQQVINQQQQQIEELKGLIEKVINGQSISSNHSSAYLKGNTPNPTSGTTLIGYHIPQESRAANLVFTDMKGAIIKSMTLSNKGTGQLTIDVASWTAGTYTYTLYVNGSQADSKKLVVAR